ncbi:hypothetical protein [Citrobacter phage Tr1]|nr:hypothetical protein [Citrobacter phage Tr1]
MKGQANTFKMFSNVNSHAVLVNAATEGDTITANLFTPENDKLLIISIKTINKGYYSLAYHYIANLNADNEEQTSNNFSLPFPATMLQSFLADIINDVF